MQGVVEEGEADARPGVHPTQLATGAGVTECLRCGGQPAVEVVAVAACHIAGNGAVGRHPVGDADRGIADGADGIGQPVVGKGSTLVVQEVLVDEGDVRRRRHTTAAGDGSGLGTGIVQRQQGFGGDAGQGHQVGTAERCCEVGSVGGVLADRSHRDGAAGAKGRGAQDGLGPCRAHHQVVDGVDVGAAADRLDQFGDHPVGADRVVLGTGAGGPVERPLGELGPATGAGAPTVWADGGLGEPALHGQQLQHGDVGLAVMTELGHIVRHPCCEVDGAVRQVGQEGHRHKGLGGGEDDEPAGIGRLTEGAGLCDLALETDCHLGCGEVAGVDLVLDAAMEGFDTGMAERGHGLYSTGEGEKDGSR